jgi:glycosyltransferase involved in cell wall biosynthesis
MAEQDRRLWVDVSTLLGSRGNTTGIVRVVSQLVRHWLADGSAPVSLCAFDRLMRAFRAVAPQELQRPQPRPPARAAAAPSAIKPSTEQARSPLLDELREAHWHLQHAGRCLGRMARSVAGMAARRGLRQAKPFLRKSSPPPFAPGDAVVLPGAAWEQPEGTEVLLALKQTLGVRPIHLIHDLTPLRHPQWNQPRLTRAFTNWLPRALRCSTLLLTISEHSRHDLIAYAHQHGADLPPIEVIREGDEPGPDEGEQYPGLPSWLGGPFALCVSTIAMHKNQTLLLHVWRRLMERHGDRAPALVLVGGPGWRGDEILRDLRADASLSRRVVHLPRINDRQLRWLYRRCLFTLYPSHYEGWGLPVAESLVHGKYCICSGASSLPEVGGAFVDYHDPLDAPTCLSLVERALLAPTWLARREQRIRAEYRITSWKDCARQILELLEQHLQIHPARAAA